MLDVLIGSKSRTQILRLLFDGSCRERYLRDLERDSGLNASALQKELVKLLKTELITSEKDGNRIYYQANQNHPIYLELVGIVEKTIGIQAILKKALSDNRIQLSLLFGSLGRKTERAESDVDILVIGRIGLRALSQLLAVPQEKIARPINPIIYTPEEFSSKLAVKNHFLTRVLEKEIVVLTGDFDAFVRPVKKRTTRLRSEFPERD